MPRDRPFRHGTVTSLRRGIVFLPSTTVAIVKGDFDTPPNCRENVSSSLTTTATIVARRDFRSRQSFRENDSLKRPQSLNDRHRCRYPRQTILSFVNVSRIDLETLTIFLSFVLSYEGKHRMTFDLIVLTKRERERERERANRFKQFIVFGVSGQRFYRTIRHRIAVSETIDTHRDRLERRSKSLII